MLQPWFLAGDPTLEGIRNVRRLEPSIGSGPLGQVLGAVSYLCLCFLAVPGQQLFLPSLMVLPFNSPETMKMPDWTRSPQTVNQKEAFLPFTWFSQVFLLQQLKPD